jgi:hypothetical protein
MSLDVKIIRELKRQLASVDVLPDSSGNFTGVCVPRLTVDGVVMIGLCMLHPSVFKDIFGEEAYEILLKQPRIPDPCGDDFDSE